MIVLNVNGKDIPDYAFESRVQELADEMQIHQRKREFARYFAFGLTPKGAAKILAHEAAIVALRPILLTIVVNIPLMAWMLNAGGITARDFICHSSVALAFHCALLFPPALNAAGFL